MSPHGIEYNNEDDPTVEGDSRSDAKRKRKYEFPVKLYSILEDMDKQEGRKDIISWLPSGDAFRIHDVEKFSKDVLPHYCNGIQYKSFIRNINLYCFQRIREAKSPHVGAYYHPMFKRGQRDLCLKITRPKRPRHDGKEARKERNVPPASERIQTVFRGPGGQVGDTSINASSASFQPPTDASPLYPQSCVGSQSQRPDESAAAGGRSSMHQMTAGASSRNFTWTSQTNEDQSNNELSLMIDIEPRPIRGPTLKKKEAAAVPSKTFLSSSFQSKVQESCMGKYHELSYINYAGVLEQSLMMKPSSIMVEAEDGEVRAGRPQHGRHVASHGSSTHTNQWMLDTAMDFNLWESLDNVGENSVEEDDALPATRPSSSYLSKSMMNQQQGQQQQQQLPPQQEQEEIRYEDDDDLSSQVSFLEFSEEYDDDDDLVADQQQDNSFGISFDNIQRMPMEPIGGGL